MRLSVHARRLVRPESPCRQTVSLSPDKEPDPYPGAGSKGCPRAVALLQPSSFHLHLWPAARGTWSDILANWTMRSGLSGTVSTRHPRRRPCSAPSVHPPHGRCVGPSHQATATVHANFLGIPSLRDSVCSFAVGCPRNESGRGVNDECCSQ